MKHNYLIITFFLFISCGKFFNKENLPEAVMKLEHPNRKYDPILKGTILKMTFKYTNTGDHPLVISEVQTSCNCTVLEFPRRPIAKGKEGYINLSFNSGQNSGAIKQYVTIIANIKNTLSNTLSFETEVIPNPDNITSDDIHETYGNYIPIKE